MSVFVLSCQNNTVYIITYQNGKTETIEVIGRLEFKDGCLYYPSFPEKALRCGVQKITTNE